MTDAVHLDRIREAARPKRWQAPEHTMQLAEFDIAYIGERRSRKWYTHPTIGELEQTATVRDGQESGDAVLPVWEDGVRKWRVFAAHEPGTFAQAANSGALKPKPARAPRPVDALAAFPFLSGSPELVVAAPGGRDGGAFLALDAPNAPQPYVRSPKAPARGAESILHRLARKGVELRSCACGEHLVASSSGGAMTPAIRAAIDGGTGGAASLLLAHVRGSLLHCCVTAHPDPVPAVTLAVGGAPFCGACE